jgi:adenosylcobinamide kinase/adenosylcobinamide-phosphate guanylyltransferase
MLPKCGLILGGAASGKSAYAETLVKTYPKDKFYLATSQIFDAEMADKKDRHIAQRGAGWTTIEEPFNAADVLLAATRDQVYLVDCATMWLTNHLLSDGDLPPKEDHLINAICRTKADVVIVSNEVGHGIVPDNKLARQFREAQGRLNIRLALNCDLVVQVVAGIPTPLKGNMP